MKRLLLLPALIALSVGTSKASIIVSLDSIAADATPGVFDWIYRAQLEPDQNMLQVTKTTPGDFFTVYDFGNIVGATFGNAPGVSNTFSVTQQLTGVTPPSTSPTDNPSIKNVTVTLTGGGDIMPPSSSGPLTLGDLVIRSTTSAITSGVFGSVAHLKTDNSLVSNIGVTQVAQVPEPGSLSMLLAGLIAFGGIILRRRNRS